MSRISDYCDAHSNRARWIFATAASLSGTTAACLFFAAQYFDSNFLLVPEDLLYGFSAAISAFFAGALAWPPKPCRSKWRMALAGIFTVALAFILMGFILTGIMVFVDHDDIKLIFIMPFLFLLFGSIYTLGIPYLIGILVSLLFANK